MKSLIFICLMIFFVSSCVTSNNETLTSPYIVNVELSYDVSKKGKPININIIKSDNIIFDNKAKKDLSKWTYKPKVVDGEAVIQKGLTVRLAYEVID